MKCAFCNSEVKKVGITLQPATSPEVEAMATALEYYADERFYFPRAIIRELQGKVKLAPVYSDFGETAKQALADFKQSKE